MAEGNKLCVGFFSLKILCCHDDTWFHLNLTFLKSWANQHIFLMEMFVLSYVNVLYVYPRLCLQVSSAWELRFRLWPDLTNQYVILIHYSPNLCKRNYLCGNLPFFKIQVNRFMPEMTHLMPRLSENASCGWGAWCHFLSFETFLSFINRLLVTI